jgi:hypothetical protein
MLKLPSPSVDCAQNSPVILMTGLTRRRSTSMASMLSRQACNAGGFSQCPGFADLKRNYVSSRFPSGLLSASFRTHPSRSLNLARIRRCAIAKIIAVDTPNISAPSAASRGPKSFHGDLMIKFPDPNVV